MILTKDIFGNQPKFGVLIDPEHESDPRFDELLTYLSRDLADVVLVGGSTSKEDNIDCVVDRISKKTKSPILLFPGNELQISSGAHGLLLPSLISGRNPEFLIGKHVDAAHLIYESGIPVFPMGYIIVDGGIQSTTLRVTQTTPIAKNDIDTIARTALAGQLLGLKCIYLEAGSGASEPISEKMIRVVKKSINIPLIVGGGIRTPGQLREAIDAGADMVVVGTVLEEYPNQITTLHEAFSQHITI